MKNNKGFTLLELLVAATIIGILAVFATTSYKNSAADARVAAAKTRTEALAGAVQRMRLEYPAFSTVSGQMEDASSTECYHSKLEDLITCGFLGNNGWGKDNYMTYWVCNGKSDGCTDTRIEDPLACMVSTNDPKMPERYRNYTYCVSATKTAEKGGS